MGDDLSLPEREPVRTPMQWSPHRNAGFSSADRDKLWRPVVSRGSFGYRKVNVADQRRDPRSQLNWMERMISTRKECPEFGIGSWQALETGTEAVFALRFEAMGGAMVVAHNLTDEPQQVKLGLSAEEHRALFQIFGDEDSEERSGSESFELAPYGYRWFRVGDPGVRTMRPAGAE